MDCDAVSRDECDNRNVSISNSVPFAERDENHMFYLLNSVY